MFGWWQRIKLCFLPRAFLLARLVPRAHRLKRKSLRLKGMRVQSFSLKNPLPFLLPSVITVRSHPGGRPPAHGVGKLEPPGRGIIRSGPRSLSRDRPIHCLGNSVSNFPPPAPCLPPRPSASPPSTQSCHALCWLVPRCTKPASPLVSQVKWVGGAHSSGGQPPSGACIPVLPNTSWCTTVRPAARTAPATCRQHYGGQPPLPFTPGISSPPHGSAASERQPQ
jgi:hypothetical protein